MLAFNNYFCKNRKSKLHFGDRVAVLNVFFYQTGGSNVDFFPINFSRFHLAVCSFGRWLIFFEKSTAGWWLISQTNVK
jgi:hypothetical protein